MIDDLLARNRIWSVNRSRADPDFFPRLARQQRPDYLWVGCADSRVPANDIVGLDPGELFVHRNVANLAPPSDINFLSVLAFAVNALEVKHVIVCGVRFPIMGSGRQHLSSPFFPYAVEQVSAKPVHLSSSLL